MDQLHFDILDQKRLDLLPSLSILKSDFYLAGGTACALYIGHRDSLDFDFFSRESFNPDDLYKTLEDILQHHQLEKIQEDKNTLTIVVDKTIKVSFFTYPYQFIDELVNTEFINLASLLDIACMKLSAIVSRATLKDYVDLYYILKEYKLGQLLELTQKKFPQLDTNLVLKSLVYFEDVVDEPLLFKPGREVSVSQVRELIEKEVKALII